MKQPIICRKLNQALALSRRVDPVLAGHYLLILLRGPNTNQTTDRFPEENLLSQTDKKMTKLPLMVVNLNTIRSKMRTRSYFNGEFTYKAFSQMKLERLI